MPRSLYIPRQVLDAIAEHMESATDRAVSGFWSAQEDEDTVTGALGESLRTGAHTVYVENDEVNGPWKWSIDYAKFRGRGGKATESFLGADGIIELTLDFGYRKDSKALLFQSKMDWQHDIGLLKQAALMSTWREASIFINYTPSEYYAYSVDSVLASKGVEKEARDRLTLKAALTQYFLRCRVGNMDLRYDARERRLTWREASGAIVATQFSIPHRIRVEIQSPTFKQKAHYEKLVPADQIHNHRMQAEPEEILMPLLSDSTEPAERRRRSLAMTYHPDRYSEADQFLRELITRRMQEINAAYDEVQVPGTKPKG